MSEQATTQALPFDLLERGVYRIAALDQDGRIPLYAVNKEGHIVASEASVPSDFHEACKRMWAALEEAEVAA